MGNRWQLTHPLELAALLSEPDRLRDSFKDRRLAAAILAREQRYRPSELELLDGGDGGLLSNGNPEPQPPSRRRPSTYGPGPKILVSRRLATAGSGSYGPQPAGVTRATG